MRYLNNGRGLTLTELLVAMSVFLILVAFMYPTFSFVSRQNDYINDNQSLNDRGQRIIDYIADDIRMMGFVVGPKENIPICPDVYGSGGVSVLRFDNNYDSNGYYDALTFITTIPVEVKQNTECVNSQPPETRDYELDVSSNATSGSNQITVDATPSTCVNDSVLQAASGNQNAKSLVAFETASQVQNVYTVQAISEKTITFSQPLNLTVPAGSTVYTVREYEYSVSETTRELRKQILGSDCSYTPLSIDEPFKNGGGIDGLQFEFIIYDPVAENTYVSDTPPAEIKDLRAIRIWLLLRSSVADRFYTDDDADPSTTGIQNYVLGTDDGTGSPVTGVSIPPFGDHYRRLLLNKTVEVKNLAS